MRDDIGPQILFPLVEIIFGRERLCVAHGHFMQAIPAKFLKTLVEESAHLIELLVRRVSKPEDREVQASEGLLRLVPEDLFDVLEKASRVIARVTFVVRRDCRQNEWLLAKLFLREVVEVDDFAVVDPEHRGFLVEHVRHLLGSSRLAAKVDPDRRHVAGHDQLAQDLSSVRSGLLSLLLEVLLRLLSAVSC